MREREAHDHQPRAGFAGPGHEPCRRRDLCFAGQRLLRLTVNQFLVGSIFVVLADSGLDQRSPIALRSAGRAFVGPNNGLFTTWLPADCAVELPAGEGREPFAIAAARLAQGKDVGALGRTLGSPVRLARPAAVRQPHGWLQGEILYADDFGNLVTNLSDVCGGVASFRNHILTTYYRAFYACRLFIAMIEQAVALPSTYSAANAGWSASRPLEWRPLR